jgi:hypothetical protein
VLLALRALTGAAGRSPASQLAGTRSRLSYAKWARTAGQSAAVMANRAQSRAESRLALGPGWVSTLLQETVAGLWQDPAVDRLLDRARAT